MNETVITVMGNVATEPELRITSGGVRVVGFRMASTERRYDKALNGWRDGDTIFYSVSCWRNTGDNALESVVVGQPLIVHGKLRNNAYEKDGQARTSLEIEAYSLGHDISKGVSSFTRATVTARREADHVNPTTVVAAAPEPDDELSPNAA
ncbi:MAG: single-stranded DNA-binding protein [Actinomycetes bacterium]